MDTNEIAAALRAAGWHDEDFRVHRRGEHTLVALGLDLVGTTPAKGGNAAALVSALRVAGFEATPAGWEHLLAGGESRVERVAYPTVEVARRLYGVSEPSRAQLTAAAQWCRQPGRGIAPLNPGFVPLLWPATEVDTALAARAETREAGKRSEGNRTSGPERADAARLGLEE